MADKQPDNSRGAKFGANGLGSEYCIQNKRGLEVIENNEVRANVRGPGVHVRQRGGPLPVRQVNNRSNGRDGVVRDE